ncbi:enoyl-CoA delta isomerase 2, mitochondrial [Ceratitis capitata]|uniref:enoyl-CoA delta isomerase 2, mitochondrial n=1 Tax=Ceratitis capitata TaxID=7213 RepID=UPI00032A2905|nr:enoyl-CoA delta isomerase 2, mitochondrial [Ceratitis capitata]
MSASNNGINTKQTTTVSTSLPTSTAKAATATAHSITKPKPNSASQPCSYSELHVQQRDRIYVITFNRPTVCNALTRRGYYELIRALNYATFDDAITTVVLTGADGCFTSGNDLTQLSQYTSPHAFFRSSNYVLRFLIKSFIFCPKVLVALVDGPCIGIGFVFAMLCDVVYCTERAYFETPFTRLGLCPEGCATYLLPQLLGRVKAAELLLFGTRLSAVEALRFNLVARIVPQSELERQLWPQLLAYARLPVESLRATKRVLAKMEREQLLHALKAECLELERLRKGETYQRAIQAFVARKDRMGSDVENKSKL